MSTSDRFEFNTVCRTCLSTENLSSLLDKPSKQYCYNEMLTMCTSVEYYENDGLPEHICIDCIHELNRCYIFATKCFQIDYKLRMIQEKSCTEESLQRPLVAIPELQMDFVKHEIKIEPMKDDDEAEETSALIEEIKIENASDTEYLPEDQPDIDAAMLQEPQQILHDQAQMSRNMLHVNILNRDYDHYESNSNIHYWPVTKSPKSGTRGRKPNAIVKKTVFLFQTKFVDYFPNSKESRDLTQRGLGYVKLRPINRFWTAEELKSYLCYLYPNIPLQLVGFRYGKSTSSSRKIHVIPNVDTTEDLLREIKAGIILLIPNKNLIFPELPMHFLPQLD